MLVRVTDLCGREEPYVADECNLNEHVRDVLYELSCDSEGTWFIGEYQYDEVDPSEAA